MDLIQLCNQYGVDNVKFGLKMSPLRHCMGIIYTTNDVEVDMDGVIVQDRYKIKDNYKIEIIGKSEDGLIGKHAFYISDLESMIRDGYVHVRVNVPDMIC